MYNVFGHIVTFPNLYSTSSAQFCPLDIFCTEEFPVVRLHARERYIKQICLQLLYSRMMGLKKARNVQELVVLYNIIVTTTQLCAFVVLTAL